jgi:hypothetical protein
VVIDARWQARIGGLLAHNADLPGSPSASTGGELESLTVTELANE